MTIPKGRKIVAAADIVLSPADQSVSGLVAGPDGKLEGNCTADAGKTEALIELTTNGYSEDDEDKAPGKKDAADDEDF